MNSHGSLQTIFSLDIDGQELGLFNKFRKTIDSLIGQDKTTEMNQLS